MNCNSAFGSFGWISWLLVIIGWFLVHSAALARERRKERLEAVDHFLAALHQLEVEALEFHQSSEFDPTASSNLRHHVERLTRRLYQQPLNCLGLNSNLFFDNANAVIAELQTSITFSNMDQSDFETKDAGSDFVRNIREAVDDLYDLVVEAKHKKIV